MRMLENPRMDTADETAEHTVMPDHPSLRLADYIDTAGLTDRSVSMGRGGRKRDADWDALVDCFTGLAMGVAEDNASHRFAAPVARAADQADPPMDLDEALTIGRRLAHMSQVREKIKAGRYESEGKLRVVCLRMMQVLGHGAGEAANA